MSDYTEKNENAENAVAAQYEQAREYLCAIAEKIALETRLEQAGEKEVASLKQKVMRLVERVDGLQSLLNNTERPASVSALDLVQGYKQATSRSKDAASTHLPTLNKMLGDGFESGTLTFLLGAPGYGKTALANHFADHIANQKRPVVYVTSEDSPHRLLSKTIARQAKINYTAVRKGHQQYLSRIETALVDYAERESAKWLRYIDVTANPYTFESVLSEARAHFETGKPGQGLLIIDYLQNLAPAYEPDRDVRISVTRFAKRLRTVASRLDCCVIALASQSRIAIKQNASNASIDLGTILTSGKESGDIEYSADVLMALVDDPARVEETITPSGQPPTRPRILAVAKNRLEDIGTVPLNWTGAYQNYVEVSEEYDG